MPEAIAILRVALILNCVGYMSRWAAQSSECMHAIYIYICMEVRATAGLLANDWFPTETTGASLRLVVCYSATKGCIRAAIVTLCVSTCC